MIMQFGGVCLSVFKKKKSEFSHDFFQIKVNFLVNFPPPLRAPASLAYTPNGRFTKLVAHVEQWRCLWCLYGVFSWGLVGRNMAI